jgi:hypothetical protein
MLTFVLVFSLMMQVPMREAFVNIKRALLGEDGYLYWANLKDAELPVFRGKVVSANLNQGVNRIRIAIEKDGVVDVSLFSLKPMCKSAAIGSELEFVGIAREFTKEPFLLGLEATAIRGCPK